MKNWSRKKKLLLWIPLLLISLFFIGSITEWSSPTLEIAIRRKEKQQLIGPSEIVDRLDFEYSSWDHLVIGETKSGYTTYEYQDGLGWDNGYLRYFPKSGEVTMFTTDYLYEQGNGLPLMPIILFPESLKGSFAQMTLTVTGIESSDTFRIGSHKEPEGYFLFMLPAGPELKSEYFWLLQQAITNSYQEYVLTGTVEIQIEFYDHAGNLIDTYSKTVTKYRTSPRRKFRRGQLLNSVPGSASGLPPLPASGLPPGGRKRQICGSISACHPRSR